MRETRITMGMPATVEIIDGSKAELDAIFDYFDEVDARFSPYKETSEVSRREFDGEDMREILEACQATKDETNGFFDVWHNGKFDPSGYVKGWAIQKAADRLTGRDYYVEIAGDLQVGGEKTWTIGIRNPFKREEIIKRVSLKNMGIATSGTAVRGDHIYNPHGGQIAGLVSLTVVAPRVIDADRFATAAFAMGADGIAFIAGRPGLEGYAIDEHGLATFTLGFTNLVI